MILTDDSYWHRTAHPLEPYFTQFKWMGNKPGTSPVGNAHVYRCSTSIFNILLTGSQEILLNNSVRAANETVAQQARILLWCRKHRPSEITDAYAAMTMLTNLPVVLVRSFSPDLQEKEERREWNLVIDQAINEIIANKPFTVECDPKVWADWVENKHLTAEEAYQKLKAIHEQPAEDHTGSGHRDDGLVPKP